MCFGALLFVGLLVAIFNEWRQILGQNAQWKCNKILGLPYVLFSASVRVFEAPFSCQLFFYDLLNQELIKPGSMICGIGCTWTLSLTYNSRAIWVDNTVCFEAIDDWHQFSSLHFIFIFPCWKLIRKYPLIKLLKSIDSTQFYHYVLQLFLRYHDTLYRLIPLCSDTVG